jgi:uncharacterized protein YjiS (DUF1127 family)
VRPSHFDVDQRDSRRAQAIAMARPIAWHRSSPAPEPHRLLAWLQMAFVVLVRWRERARQRNQLAQLDSRMLRDIGITPSEAARECDKPFWRV